MNPPEDLSQPITAFADGVPYVAHAAVVSPGGLPLACSYGLPGDRVDQLAALASGLTSLVQGAARLFQGGPAVQTVVIMKQGMLILKLLGGASMYTQQPLLRRAAPPCRQQGKRSLTGHWLSSASGHWAAREPLSAG